MIRYLTIIFLFVSFTFSAYSQQEDDETYIQFSGVVVTGDSLQVIPYANIRIKGSNRGATSNYDGFFSFVAKPGEELIFSAIGFKNSTYKIPDTLHKKHYSWIQMMQTDTILLVETVIYPWPTVEDLKRAIVALELPETDYDRAMKNLELQKMKELAMEMPMNGSMNYRNQIQQVIDKNYYNGQKMPNHLLNPFAWKEFIEAWRDGKFFK